MIKKLIGRENFKHNFILFIASVVITVFSIMTGAYFKTGYNINVGDVSPKRFTASRAIENTFATDKIKAEVENSVSPLYKHDTEVQNKVMEQVETFFDELKVYLDANYKNKSPENKLIDGQQAQAQDQTQSQSQSQQTPNVPIPSIYITNNQYEVLSQLKDKSFKEFKEKVLTIVSTVFEQGIKQDSISNNLVFIKDELDKLNWDENLKNTGYTIISSVLQPNLVLDEEATEKAKEQKVAEVKPVMLLKGQNIIYEGEIITDEVYSILNSLGLINKGYKENVIPNIGAVIISLLILTALVLYIYYYKRSILHTKKESLLLFTLFVICIILSRMMVKLPYIFIPILIITMLVSILMDIQLAIVFNVVITVIALLIYKGDLEFFIYFIISGVFTAIITKYTYDRNKIITAGIIISLINAIISVGLTFFFEKNNLSNFVFMNNVIYAFSSGLLSVIISVGSLPFWEVAFDAVTPIKLLELTNPNNEILRRLIIEAPGTYHHSLIVANLAETAAYNIGANHTMARVGGYYHDIGKLKYPQYYAENQGGQNPHDYMDPYDSVKVIINHVANGIEIAEEHNLPKIVKDMIVQHHGSTVIKYFYHKAISMYPPNSVEIEDFKYMNPNPKSKEAAVVMLADTVEAAVRSIVPSSKSFDEVESLVKILIKEKLDDGYLDDSLLTIKDVITIRKSFLTVFKGMYHERVPYPKENKLGEIK